MPGQRTNLARLSSQHQQLERKRQTELDLFPFLSLFLCVMGVLAMLQILLLLAYTPKVALVADAEQSYQVPYRIYCFPDGFLAVSPTERLPALLAAAPAGDRGSVESIHAQRRQTNTVLQAQQQNYMRLLEPPAPENIVRHLRDIAGINATARDAGFLYEEYILFGVFPGGGTTLQTFREMLLQPQYAGIAIGLDPLDAEWRLSL